MSCNEDNQGTNNYIFIESKELIELDDKSKNYIVPSLPAAKFECRLIGPMRTAKKNCKIVILDAFGYENRIKYVYRQYFKKEDSFEIIKLNNEFEIVDTIKNYIKDHTPIDNYVVVDSKSVKNMQVHFPLHCVYIDDEIDNLFINRIARKIRYGNGWEENYMYSKLDRIDDNFENVIFLDIDGVLNRNILSCEEAYKDKPIVKEFVKNLAEIVKQTKAEIILSSPWRKVITRFGDGSLYDEAKEAIRELFTLFSEYNLSIAGATPIISNDSDGRPLEIKTWLAKRPSVHNFVILDDEDFWRWNWIESHVVKTSDEVVDEATMEYSRQHTGLEEKYISQAVEKLSMYNKSKWCVPENKDIKMWYDKVKPYNFLFIESKELVELNVESNTYSIKNSFVTGFENRILGAMRNSKTTGKLVILDILGYADIIRESFKDEYIEIIELNDESVIVDTITKYIKEHDSINNYVVVDSKSVIDMQVHFPLHCIYVNDGMDDLFYKQIVRKFVYGNGWEKDYMYSELEEIDDNFENVIFLDIDGVLNRDHNIHKEDKTLIVDEFVENLVSIVKQTKAEIVLSSSWRGNIDRIGDDSLFEEKHHDAKVLFTYLSKYNLCLAGETPIIGSGSDSRPLEIRTWLKKRPSVSNFVILDDDTFWSWRELSDYVVTTSYEEKEKYKDEIWHDVRHAGLEEKYISEVVDILKKSSEKSEIA